MKINLIWIKTIDGKWTSQYNNIELTLSKLVFPCKNGKTIYTYNIYFNIDTEAFIKNNGNKYLEFEIELNSNNLKDSKNEVKEIIDKLLNTFKERSI